MALAILGVLLIITAGVLYLVQRSQERKRRDIATTETMSASQLAGLATSVSGELGDTTRFRQVVAVRGNTRCDSPLTSEAASEPCVVFETTVTRDYEEVYSETDSETGRSEERTRRSSEVVSQNRRSVEFWVEDDSGRVKVDPTGASVDLMQVVDRFEPGEPSLLGGSISIGGLSINLGGGGFRGGGSRTIGYRVREKTLPVGRRVYVLGEASTGSGELMIHKSVERGKRFLISLKSDEELVRSAGKAARVLYFSAIGSGALGVVLLVVGLATRR